jgi:hypothetical protein
MTYINLIAQSPMRNMHVMQRNEGVATVESSAGFSTIRAEQGQGTLRPMAARSRRNVGALRPEIHNSAHRRSGCNGQRKEQASNLRFESSCIFFCLFYTQAKFLTLLSKTVAPLHHFQFKSFIIKVLGVVQRWVQEGATGCNGGETEGWFFALHHALTQGLARHYAQMVQWCTAIDVYENASR